MNIKIFYYNIEMDYNKILKFVGLIIVILFFSYLNSRKPSTEIKETFTPKIREFYNKNKRKIRNTYEDFKIKGQNTMNSFNRKYNSS